MKVIKSRKNKKKPQDQSKLGFGKYFTDHMFTMEYEEGKGWHNEKVQPYAPLALDPGTMILHYAQGIFEGMKAFRAADGSINIFRPMENFLRMNRSAERMCIPQFDAGVAMEGLKKLIEVDKAWIPSEPGTALYIRPTIIATDVALGVHASHKYLFFIVLCPVGSYYANGLQPVSIYVEDFYVRSAVGGTGEAKCIGNYAASLKAAEVAAAQGFDQVLWLDAKDKKYVEEVGSMNMFFVIGDEVCTPMLTGSILPGITRKSSLEVLKKAGYKTAERKISIDEVVAAAEKGELKEAFGTGTAAVISPVGSLTYKGKTYEVGGGKMGEITQFLYDRITGIQRGEIADEFGWIEKL